jgi:hypothetical protein
MHPGFSMFVVVFVSSGLQYIAAGTGFVCGKGSGLSGASSHEHENLYPFPAVGTFYFRRPGGVLSLVASIQQHEHSSCFFLILSQEQRSCKKSNSPWWTFFGPFGILAENTHVKGSL